MRTRRGRVRSRWPFAGVLVAAACLAGAASAQAAVLDPGPPSIESLSVSQISSHRATLVAQIDPDQLETTFQFWVEDANCQNVPPGYGECDSISIREVGEGTIAAGPDSQYVSATLNHLQAQYAYAYWVVATNGAGEKKSPVQFFKALPAPSVDAESVSGQAPNPIELHATIDPHGQAVYYQFQLVSDPGGYGLELACPEPGPEPARVPFCTGEFAQGALPVGRLEAGEGPQEVSLNLDAAGAALKVGATYHYRVLVAPAVPTEDTVQWEGPPTIGGDQSFTVGEDDVSRSPTTSPPSAPGPSGGTADGSSSGAGPSTGALVTPLPRLIPHTHVVSKGNAHKRRHHRRHRRKARAGRRHR